MVRRRVRVGILKRQGQAVGSATVEGDRERLPSRHGTGRIWDLKRGTDGHPADKGLDVPGAAGASRVKFSGPATDKKSLFARRPVLDAARVRISASYAPSTASTIDSTASKGARRAPSMWSRSAMNPGEL